MAKKPASIENSASAEMYQVKGELIIDVVKELIEAGKIDELRAFVKRKKLFARVDEATVKSLKRKLLKAAPPEARAATRAATTAVAAAATSDDPCRRG